MVNQRLRFNAMVKVMVMIILIVMGLGVVVLHAQQAETLDVGCGQIVVYPSDSTGSYQNTFLTGQSFYMALRLESTTTTNCTINVDILGEEPNGATVSLYSGSLTLKNYQTLIIPVVNPVTSSTPSGTWVIVVTVTNPNTGESQSATFNIYINVASTTATTATTSIITPTPPPSPISPLMLAIVVAVIIIVAAIGAAVYLRGPSAQPSAQAQPQAIQTPSPAPRPSTVGPTVAAKREEATRAGAVLYRLRLPNGIEIPVTEPVKVFGRETLEKYGVPADIAQMITREERGGHFRIYYQGGKWYIEDLNSTNGTLLNGKEIKGKGPQELKNGDTISPAGILNMKFITEGSTQVYSSGGG
mgnify:CR=1 FL=1